MFIIMGCFMYKSIIIEKKDKIATVLLNRPEVLNAMDFAMKDEMSAALQEIERDDGISVVIITGNGRAFCAGADIKSTMGQKYLSNDGRKRMKKGFSMYRTIMGSDKIYIAAINGAISGSGFSLACWCDFRIAADDAKFGMPFIDIGLVADGGLLYTLPRLIGLAKTKELAMLGGRIDAQKAYEYGIVTRIVKKEELISSAMAFAEDISKKSYVALALTKSITNRTFEVSADNLLEMEASAQDICFTTDCHNEVIAKILEKIK